MKTNIIENFKHLSKTRKIEKHINDYVLGWVLFNNSAVNSINKAFILFWVYIGSLLEFSLTIKKLSQSDMPLQDA